MLRITVAIAIAAIGIAIVMICANLSFQGYSNTFPTIYGAGLIGGAISAMAFAVTYAIPVTRKQDNTQGFVLALGLLAICMPADAIGNIFALGGAVDEKEAQYEADLAEYTTASDALVVIRDRIDTARAELVTASGDDILAAQRLLMLKGMYAGKLDGMAGPQTQAAMIQLAGTLQSDLKTLETDEKANMAIVSQGAPANVAGSEMLKAILISLGMTIITLIASYLSSSIMTAGKGLEDELEALEEQAGQFEKDVVNLVEWLDAA